MACSTCPAHSTSGLASKVLSDCQCNAGYEPGPDRYGNQGCQPCNSINTNKVKGNKGNTPCTPCTGNTIPNDNYVGTACNSVPANSRAAGRPPYTDFICNTGYVYDKPSNSCKPDDSLQWAPCFNGDVGARRGPFECNLGRGNVGPFWTRIGSALPNGSFCNINNDCASGVCSVGCGSTGHVCLPPGVQPQRCHGTGITGSTNCGPFAPCAYRYGGCRGTVGGGPNGQYDPLCRGGNNRGCSRNANATGTNLC